MPVLLKHGGKHITKSSSHQSFPRADSNLSRQSSRPTIASVGSRVGNAGSNLLQEVRRRSRQPTLQFSEKLKNPKEWLRAFKRVYRRYHLKYLLPLAFVMIYMCVGAILFLWLESGAEEQRIENRRRDYNREMELLVKRIEEISKDQAAQKQQNRRRFVREAVTHFHEQLEIEPQIQPEWTLTSAMYFSGTIFTTIGFGDIACQTVAGRIMTVVYAIVGIPIMLITLNDLGKFLYKSINDVLGAYDRRLAWLKKFRHKEYQPVTKTDDLNTIEQGNGTALGIVEEPPHRVSFNLRPPSEELTLNMETFDDTDAHADTPESTQITTNNNNTSSPSQQAPTAVLRQRSDTAENSLDLLNGQEDFGEDELLAQTAPPPRMPVLVALFITVGWIFFCAALFKIWEDWTYAESCYFMFISLSTIGLGDLSVKRRDLMVICFIFVIIGLSLVSMCISVMQAALEDLYKRMLMKLLADYQAKLAQGDHKGASMGMMRMWGNSKTAKYLMPMLSAETRRQVMTQIQEEAKESGLEIPPIFEDLDEKTGMPKILAVAQEAVANEEKAESMIENIVRQSDPTRMSMPSRTPGPNVVYYDSSIQTDEKIFEDKNHQTMEAVTDDLAIQTDAESEVQLSDEGIQTDQISSTEDQTQTHSIESKDKETNTTLSSSFESTEVQTELITTLEQALQTYVVDLVEMESQTHIVETQNQRIQTPYPEMNSVDVQTEDTDLGEAYKGPSRITQARRRIQKAFRSRSKNPTESSDQLEPEMSEWKEVEEDEEGGSEDLMRSSTESLDWDPIDGMHAERQRPVKDLKRIFDKNKGSRKTSRKESTSKRKESRRESRKDSGK